MVNSTLSSELLFENFLPEGAWWNLGVKFSKVCSLLEIYCVYNVLLSWLFLNFYKRESRGMFAWGNLCLKCQHQETVCMGERERESVREQEIREKERKNEREKERQCEKENTRVRGRERDRKCVVCIWECAIKGQKREKESARARAKMHVCVTKGSAGEFWLERQAPSSGCRRESIWCCDCWYLMRSPPAPQEPPWGRALRRQARRHFQWRLLEGRRGRSWKYESVVFGGVWGYSGVWERVWAGIGEFSNWSVESGTVENISRRCRKCLEVFGSIRGVLLLLACISGF